MEKPVSQSDRPPISAGEARGRLAKRTEETKLLRALPLYEQVRREITELILGGAWARGSQIPGEETLAARFGVSVGTVRRALSELVAEGFLARRRRVGTVVTDRSPHHSMRFMHHYYRLHRQDGELAHSEARVVGLETATASDEERRRLALTGARPDVIRIRRLRSVDGRPAMHERLVLPAHRYPEFPGPETLPQLIYVFFEEHYGIRLSLARESLRADLADNADADLLHVSSGSPILEIDRIAFDTAHDVVEWRVCRALTQRFRYLNEVR